MRDNLEIEKASEQGSFDDITENEILGLWGSLKSTGLSAEEAWNAIVTGLALDMAFAGKRNCKWTEH
ncbi:MAG: hypothetical protein HY695_09435 [Deltaproteobacteria bacterium]|nr:hypothetical protein [Deltaproteobacteria bacterium]